MKRRGMGCAMRGGGIVGRGGGETKYFRSGGMVKKPSPRAKAAAPAGPIAGGIGSLPQRPMVAPRPGMKKGGYVKGC